MACVCAERQHSKKHILARAANITESDLKKKIFLAHHQFWEYFSCSEYQKSGKSKGLSSALYCFLEYAQYTFLI